MRIVKLNEAMQRLNPCECRNKECAALNAWVGHRPPSRHGATSCGKHAKYSVDGHYLCTDCMRFRRFPTEGEEEQ